MRWPIGSTLGAMRRSPSSNTSAKEGEKAFFVYGFAKSKRSNIEQDEVEVFKKAARELLALSDIQIAQLIENEALAEVADDNEA